MFKTPLLSRARHLLKTLAFSESLPRAWRNRGIEMFWDRQAPVIHARWGHSREDAGVIARILDICHPTSVLDIGCGTGRLFDIYRDRGVREIQGVDISATALARARIAHPDVPTVHTSLQQADFDRPFDLIVSNRVLQHVSRQEIAAVVHKLCACGRFVYLNELSASDGVPEDFWMVQHDYEQLFNARGWRLLERDFIGTQTYMLFQAGTPLPI
jgi:SAM-dependent methyltransferase